MNDNNLSPEQREYARTFVSGAKFALGNRLNRSLSVDDLHAEIAALEKTVRLSPSDAKGWGEKAELEYAISCAAYNGDKAGELAGLKRLCEIKLSKLKQAAEKKTQSEVRQKQAEKEDDLYWFLRTAGQFKSDKELLDFVKSVGSRRCSDGK